MIWFLATLAGVFLAGWLFFRWRYLQLLGALQQLALEGKISKRQKGKAWSLYLQELKGQGKQAKQLALREKDDLKGVLQFLPSPVWIQNEQGIILRGNSAFCELLDKDFEPDFYWNLIDFPELFRFVDDFDADSQSTKNIKLNEKHFVQPGQARICPLAARCSFCICRKFFSDFLWEIARAHWLGACNCEENLEKQQIAVQSQLGQGTRVSMSKQ